MKRALLVLALGTPCAQTSLAQTQASLGVGVGTVRFPGGTSFSSATFAPALEYGTEARYGSVAGSLASLPGGAWSLQGRADVWAATRPLLGRMRLGAEGIWAGTRRTDGGWTAAAHGIGEVLWWTSNWGVGVGAGPSGGWIQDAPSVGAFHVPERRGDSVVVRFSFEGAKAVAIAGDWTAWQPVPLRPLAGDEWEGAFLLESGLYHFNVLVDGWDWVVPNGVATVRDGLGGLVAVLLVP